MPQPKTEKKNVNKNPAMQRASDYKAIYFNNAQVGHTPFDIFMILGEASADPHHEHGLLEHRVRATTTPAEALLLARFLVNAVKQWEINTGQKVQLPPSEALGKKADTTKEVQ